MLSKTKAIAKLQQHITEIQTIKNLPDFSPEYKKWHRDSEVTIENVFGQGTRHVKDFTEIRYSPIMFSSATPDSVFREEFLGGLDEAKAVLLSLISEIEEYWGDEPEPISRNALCFIERICDRFHLVARQLRSRHDNRESLLVEDEYDVQDLFHALLTLEFDDIRAEEWTPSYAGSASRTDFLLKQERIVVEIKKTRRELVAKQVGEQLIIDIQRYKAHPDCQSLVCFVYDPEGRIANPRGIENDLNGTGNGIDVKVIITPRGI
jgi:hypothetical protein